MDEANTLLCPHCFSGSLLRAVLQSWDTFSDCWTHDQEENVRCADCGADGLVPLRKEGPTLRVQVATALMPALADGDRSGLTEAQGRALDAFEGEARDRFGSGCWQLFSAPAPLTAQCAITKARTDTVPALWVPVAGRQRYTVSIRQEVEYEVTVHADSAADAEEDALAIFLENGGGQEVLAEDPRISEVRPT
ncbi:MAG TPA: hypothetical protein DD491_06880 [Halieaceae bacterium]|nr:hypothetical protein [Halieaceae bacterium]